MFKNIPFVIVMLLFICFITSESYSDETKMPKSKSQKFETFKDKAQFDAFLNKYRQRQSNDLTITNVRMDYDIVPIAYISFDSKFDLVDVSIVVYDDLGNFITHITYEHFEKLEEHGPFEIPLVLDGKKSNTYWLIFTSQNDKYATTHKVVVDKKK